MTVHSLLPHSDFPAPTLSLSVEAERVGAGELELTYRLAGDIGAVIVPDLADAHFTDELWRATCFEAFLADPAGPGYVELNFAPSMEWAAYGFAAYRDGAESLREFHPVTALSVTPAELVLGVGISLPMLADVAMWQLGLAAVIQAVDGSRSYWALKHAGGRPDFHNRDCFIATLAAPDTA